MKKYICFALAIVMVFSFVACSNGGGATNTDELTETQTVVKDVIETIPVTDEGGSVVNYETTVVGTEVITTDVAVTTAPTTGGASNVPSTADSEDESLLSELQGLLSGDDGGEGLEMDTTATTMPRKGKETVLPTDAGSGYPVQSKTYEEILKGDTYTLEVNTTIMAEDASVSMPAKYVKKGDDFAMVTTVNLSEILGEAMSEEDLDLGPLGSLFGNLSSGITVKYISQGGKHYMVIPVMSTYMEIDEGMMSDSGSDGFDLLSDMGDAKYLGASTVVSDGQEYVCEEYELNDEELGSTVTIRRYYQGGNLKRIETEDSVDATTYIVDVKHVSADADGSVFRIPPTYQKRSMDEMS